MLRELHISGLGVIDDLDLDLHAGLNVLTGETGAGKTMVTVGLALALGARADSSLVRDGAKAARVQARFDATQSAADWSEDDEVLLSRSVSADGKSAARVGGQLATASTLADLSGAFVEVHGQHQAQRLLSPATQTAFLDRFAGDAHVVSLTAYRDTWDRWRDTRAALEALTAASRERERELDLLAYQVREIEAVDLRDGETERMTSEEARLAHVERLLERATEAEETLSGDGSLGDAAAGAANALTDAARLDPRAETLADRARSLSTELAELARDVRDYREGLSADPQRLQQIRERQAVLNGLQRKYGATETEVLSFLEEATSRLTALATADERLAELSGTADRLQTELHERAGVVTDGRAKAAPTLATALERELQQLGMPGATVEVEMDPLPELGPTGAERVELRLSPSPGQKASPLAKTASGGELSRTMLACRSVMADLDDVPTLVFDEIDVGIGGEAGLAVGRRLAHLAESRQILVVTHLPQIACFADRHILVEKTSGTATVRALSDDERVRELSRMLAGLTGSDGAVTHAEELLATGSASRGTVA
ncbi:MAG: DNA repair protein RecN [Actinomycetota bacterium]